MNEEKNTQSREEKPLDEKRKKALLRYLGIMFVVAFVFVLISMVGELRDKQNTINLLDSSSSSALNKVEQLQENNRQLETDNAYLKGRIEELEYRLEIWKNELNEAEKQIKDLEYDNAILEQNVGSANTQKELTNQAYELLAQMVLADAIGEDYTDLINQMCNLELEHFLKGPAVELFANLINKGEE